MTRLEEVVSKVINVMNKADQDLSRTNSMQKIAKEKLLLALKGDSDAEVEVARQEAIDTFTAAIDVYIANAKQLRVLQKEAEDAATRR